MMIHNESRRPDDRALIEQHGRTVRIDAKGLAHVYDEHGKRIGRELPPDGATFGGRQ